MRLSSFDGTESIVADCVAPSQHQQLAEAFCDGMPVIPRGAGLSYCAVSAGEGVRSVSSVLLNRVLNFDNINGIIDVEPGICLGNLFKFTTQRGWILPVMPGHPSITIGGCIGCNVHGKNQYREGNFIGVVDSFTLRHPDHGEIRCSRDQEATLFQLTIGGFGLTGFITSVRLKLKPLGCPAVRLRRITVASLAETVEIMEQYKQQAELLYSWNNLNFHGGTFGHGFVYVGVPASSPVYEKAIFRHLKSDERSRMPLSAYSRFTTRLMFDVYSLSQHLSAEDKLIGWARAAFPVNGSEFYFWLFGQRGFREYQLLVPHSRWAEIEEALPSLIRRRKVPITLGSVKLFRGQSDLLHFDGTGMVLTIDVPEGDDAHKFFEDLDRLTLSCGGLVNLAKDGRVGADFVSRVFPGYDRFKRELRAFDPRGRFDSSLRRRLNV